MAGFSAEFYSSYLRNMNDKDVISDPRAVSPEAIPGATRRDNEAIDTGKHRI